MEQQIRIVLITCIVGICIGCGPGKKLKFARSEANELRDRNNELTRSTRALQANVDHLTAQNDSMTQQFDNYKKECEATKRTLGEVNTILQEEAQTMESVKATIEQALVGFHDKGVDVYSKQGLVYVSLSDELLYKSGSARLGKEGKKALSNLASVLNNYPRLKVVVVGNTDNVPTKRDDNWTLSTERANGVVRILRDDYKVDPSRLTSAGKGKYNPIADNGTEEGRSKNRRTDIILNPDLDRIWDTARKDR